MKRGEPVMSVAAMSVGNRSLAEVGIGRGGEAVRLAAQRVPGGLAAKNGPGGPQPEGLGVKNGPGGPRPGCGGRGASGAETLERLRGLVERYRRRRRWWFDRGDEVIATGLRALDEVLPGGGLPRGAVTELLSGGAGIGARTLALRVAIRAAGILCTPQMAIRGLDGSSPGDTLFSKRAESGISLTPQKAVVVVDCEGDFYPPAAVAMGLPADRLLMVRPRNPAEALWAADQALRSGAVAAVVATRLPLDRTRSRRLQLAAEDSGGMGLILNPVAPFRRRKEGLLAEDRVSGSTFAAVRLLIDPVRESLMAGDARPYGSHARSRPGGVGACPPPARRCRVTLLKVREGRPVEPFIAELDDETCDVSLHPLRVERPAGDASRRLSA